MRVLFATALFLALMTGSVRAQSDVKLGASFWSGSTEMSSVGGATALGLAGWASVTRGQYYGALRFDWFGIAQDCSGCGDGDGFMLFLLPGIRLADFGPVTMHADLGPGVIWLGDSRGIGPRASLQLELNLWRIGFGAEAFVARSLGSDETRPAGVGATLTVRL